MAQSFLFGAQVSDRVGSGHYFAGNSIYHFDACAGECQSLVRIIRKQSNSAETKLMEDRSGQPEIRAQDWHPLYRARRPAERRLAISLSRQCRGLPDIRRSEVPGLPRRWLA